MPPPNLPPYLPSNSPRIIGLAGSFSSPSKTRALVDVAALKTAHRFGGTAASYDLTDIGPSLGAATHLDALDPLARAIVDNVPSADALIIGSPVCKGSYLPNQSLRDRKA